MPALRAVPTRAGAPTSACRPTTLAVFPRRPRRLCPLAHRHKVTFSCCFSVSSQPQPQRVGSGWVVFRMQLAAQRLLGLGKYPPFCCFCLSTHFLFTCRHQRYRFRASLTPHKVSLALRVPLALLSHRRPRAFPLPRRPHRVCVCRLSGCAGVHWVAPRGVGRAAQRGAVGSPLVGSQEPWGASPDTGVFCG